MIVYGWKPEGLWLWQTIIRKVEGVGVGGERGAGESPQLRNPQLWMESVCCRYGARVCEEGRDDVRLGGRHPNGVMWTGWR